MRWLLFGLLLIAAPAVAGVPADVGTAGSARVIAAAPDASWVMMCQARKDTNHDGVISVQPAFAGTTGDTQDAYLVVGGGAGARIDDVIEVDPSGKRIVVQRAKHLILLEPAKGDELDLTKRGAIKVFFDDTGARLGYVKKRGKAMRIVIRELASGREVELDPGPGELFSVDLRGSWIDAQVLEHKRGDEPFSIQADRPPRRCWTGMLSDVSSSHGTPPVRRWIPIAGGKPRAIEGALARFGAEMLVRAPDRALVLEAADGSARELVPASCGGRVLGGDATAGTLIVACKDNALVEYGGKTPRSIGAKVPAGEGEELTDDRFLLITAKDAGSLLVDVKTGANREVGVYQQRYAHRGSITVISRGERLVVLDGKAEHDLGAIERYPASFEAGHYVFVDPLVVDLDTGALVGHAPATANVQALDDAGRLLVGTTGRTRWDYTNGPLTWISPVP